MGHPHPGVVSGQRIAADPTFFVGRRDEVAGVRELLSASRLVTLTGTGGVGKTRLARQAAAEVRRAFPDGVWFVDVAAGPPVVPEGARPAADGGPRRTLLVLDGCEARLPGCAELVGGLLRASPWLRVLATSRQPLDVGGEVTFPVPPLAPADAVTLLTARAGLDPDGATADTLAEICRRLDGLPLAVELAAARVGELTPAQVLARLVDPVTGRTTVLDGLGRARPSSAGVLPRHETMRACVEWSHDLCTEAERTLWARLSVFEDGFELAAVEAVCGGGSLPDDLLDLVTSLVTKSVLVRHDDGHVVRYRMPAAVREHGQDRLRASGEEDACRRRHRDRFERLALSSRAAWPGPRQDEYLARLDRDVSNLLAAVETSLAEPGAAGRALALLTAVPVGFWQLRGLLPECRRRLGAALEVATAPTPLRARALALAGHVAFGLGDAAAAERWGGAARVLALRVGAVPELARATHVLGLAALAGGDLGDAVALQTRALELVGLVSDADPELRLGLLDAAAMAAALTGDRERATACRDAVLRVTGQPGDGYHRTRTLAACALAAWRRHDPDDAAREAAASLRLARRPGAGDAPAAWDLPVLRLDLEVLGWVAARRQRHRRAATLLAAAETLGAEAHEARAALRHVVADHERCVRRARHALGDDAYEAARRRGLGLGAEEVAELALGPDHEHRGPPGGPPATDTDASTPLTRREQQVAELVARGLSNREIAAALVVSQRTAEAHVGNILTKLGFGTRAQIAAWAAGRHLAD